MKTNLTITQVIEGFPEECKNLIPKVNQELKKYLKPYTKHCKYIRNRNLPDSFTEWFLLQVIKVIYKVEKIEKQIKQNEIIHRIVTTPKDKDNGQITDLMIQQAKGVSIQTLYDFEKPRFQNARMTARCPFHKEKTGSFIVYKTNTFYCFGACHTGGDSIAFIMKLYGFNFIKAVKYLLNR